jgi:hypothetical protein
MEKYAPILLLFLFSLHLAVEGGLLLWYGIQNESFTQQFCINKKIEDNTCNGKCYIQKIVVTNGESSGDEPGSVGLLSPSLSLKGLPIATNGPVFPPKTPLPTHSFLYQFSHLFSHQTDVFRPPA